MEQDYLLKLTMAVYKISDLFPEREPLRWQIKESAGKVLIEAIKADFLPGARDKVLAETRAIAALFELADRYHWINPKNLLILKQEYARLSQDMGQKSLPTPREERLYPAKMEAKQPSVIAVKPKSAPFSRPDTPRIPPKRRQEKITSMLNIKKRIDLSELRKIFPTVGARTLRRDMEAMLEKGLISRKRNGQKDVTYQLLENGHNL